MLFYAGHGVQIDGKNYLLPVDARIESGAELTADMTDLDTILAGLDDQVRTNIVILDACRDNPMAQQTASRGNAGRVAIAFRARRAHGPRQRRHRRAPARCSPSRPAPGQVALDGNGENSPFSRRWRATSARPGSKSSRC